MKKILLVSLVFLIAGCSDSENSTPRSNGSDILSQEECECRGGEYAKTGTGLAMAGTVGVPISRYACFKDGEAIYQVFRDETCEKYWELKNEKRYKWSK